MNLYTFVGNCCGVNAIHGLPPKKEDFILQLKKVIVDYYDAPMRGSHFLVTTRHTQWRQEAYLKELGFTLVSTERNSNSGNYVSLWVMPRAKVNRMLRNVKVKKPQKYNIFGFVN